jgi:hypothetical protein
MTHSAYLDYEAAAKARDMAPRESHMLGDVRIEALDNFVVRINLFYGPLPIDLSREQAMALADAIYRLNTKTSAPRIEE